MSFRTRFLAVSQIFRYREAVIGISGSYFNNDVETRGEFKTNYFNQLGGVKQMAS